MEGKIKKLSQQAENTNKEVSIIKKKIEILELKNTVTKKKKFSRQTQQQLWASWRNKPTNLKIHLLRLSRWRMGGKKNKEKLRALKTCGISSSVYHIHNVFNKYIMYIIQES